jgi:hypothetical protein
MRIGVIRGDLPGPIHLQDVETVSQYNPPTEPRGQERYIGRPTTAEIEAALANSSTGAGAVIQGSDISGSFPITLSGANNVLKLRLSATASFTSVTVATGAKANIAALVAAVNAALVGTGVVAYQGPGSGQRLAIESTTRGVNSYLEIDTTGNGSTFDTPAGFTAGARTMPTAAAFITALNPVLGTLDVSTTTINAVGASTNANALSLIPTARGTQAAIAEAIAPRFYETSVAIDSYLVGMISEYRSASYNPDIRRYGSAGNGAAIAVVQDDGVTAFSAGLPVLSVADLNTPSTGILTITGTGLGSFDSKETAVRVIGPNINKRIEQKAIEAAGGSVSATTIVIPAALLPGATLTTTTARVQVRQRVSAAVAMT